MNNQVSIKINPLVLSKSPSLFVKTRLIREIKVKGKSPQIDKQVDEVISKWAGVKKEDLNKMPLIITYRKMAEELGGDSNKMLPAVEGLITRGVLQGRFPRINSTVDVTNVISLNHLIPIGLFDYEKIEGDIELTLSKHGDKFIPIGKDKPIELQTDTPILTDSIGIFSAVGSRDSARTMIRNTSHNIMAFSWGIEGVDPRLVAETLEKCVSELCS